MAEDPTGAGADPAGFVARLPGWNDRDRVAYLFNEFADGEVDDDVVEWWYKAALAYCKAHGHCSVSAARLASVVRTELEPQGVPMMFTHLLSSNKLQPVADLLKPPVSTKRWLLDVAVVQPASFLLSKLWGGDTRPQPTDPHAELAVTEVVVQMADTLYASTIAKGGPRAVLLDNPSKGNVPQSPPLSVPAICQGVPALRHTTPTEQRVLVHTLVSQGRARLVDVPSHGQGVVIGKVSVSVTTSALSLSLQLHIHSLEVQVAAMNKKAESHFAQARAYHRVKNDSTAKFHLRRRRAIHAAAEKTLSSLANLHQVQDKISGMEDDALIMDAYQVGLQAMRVTKAELGLDADTVAEIVDEVGAEIDEAKAVSDSLAQDMSLLEASEDELLDELERELAEDAAGGGGGATAATPTAAHTAAAAPVPAPAPARASATATPLPAVATPVAAAAAAGSDAHLDDLTKRLSALGVSNAATTSDAAPAPVAEGSSSSSRGMMPTAEPA